MSLLGGSSNDYGLNASIAIKVDGREITSQNVRATDFMVEMSTSKEAGICEVRLQGIVPGVIEKLPFPKSDMSKIKVGHSLEILVANSNGGELSKEKTVFTGFVESLEISFDENFFIGVIRGMDAKMWMMANKFTGERGKANDGYDKVVNAILSNYSAQTKKGQVKLTSNAKLKNSCYQIDESDYNYLCKIARMTGSMFFVDNEGKTSFCSAENLISKIEKISFGDKNVCKVSMRASVWGTVKSVTVTATNSANSAEKIEATSSSSKSIGSGKNSGNMVSQNYSSPTTGVRCVHIYDDSVKSQEEAKALADAIFTEREKQLIEAELLLIGNPNLSIGKGVELKDFGEPLDGKYLIAGVRHSYGIYSNDGKYHTALLLSSNRSNL